MMVRLEKVVRLVVVERMVADQEILTAPIQAESAAAAAAAMTGRRVIPKPAAVAAVLETAPAIPVQEDWVGLLTRLEEEGAVRPETTPEVSVLTQGAQQPIPGHPRVIVPEVQWVVALVKKLPVKVDLLQQEMQTPAAAAAAFMGMLP